MTVEVEIQMASFANANLYEHVDLFMIINLSHRTDRKAHITNELNRVQIPQEKIKFIEAIYQPGFGAVGCTKSHIVCLEYAIQHKLKSIVIFEDDFTIRPLHVWYEAWAFLNKNQELQYDVIMLAGNILRSVPFKEKMIRVLDGHTTSGYIVHWSFFESLLTNFQEGLRHLERTYRGRSYAIDQYWKRLQPSAKWFCFQPRLGYQYPSFSDIEKRVVQYGC